MMLSQESVAGESMANCGQWHLEREIGHGAYGVVFLAEGPDGERAAVKVCRRDAIGEERYERELRGAKLYRTIPSQEGLVRMREFVEESWGFYAVMDLADDEFGDRDFALDEYRPKTLADVIEGEKALPLDECVKLGMALAKGLATLQRHHLLHRDIKPGNVIYVGGHPVLSDPGLLVEESEATSLVGTPGYVPPENFTDAASDIYSLGLTLKAASFGRRLEDLDKGPALEADTGAKFFPAWWRILNKATDPVPSRRYRSAKALAKDLETLQRRICICAIAKSRIARVLLLVFTIAAVAVVVLLAFSIKDAKNQMRVDVGNLIQEAEEKARAAQMRRAYRDTFDGISEEELSFLVAIDGKETFGGIVSKEEKDKARKITSKYLGIDKALDDLVDSLEEGKVRRSKENLKNDL
jgi:serine/threonine protein kinase